MSSVWWAVAEELTPYQQWFIDFNTTALNIGLMAGGIVIFLLAIIAVRGLSSWK